MMWENEGPNRSTRKCRTKNAGAGNSGPENAGAAIHATRKRFVLFSVDLQKSAADGGEFGPQCRMLVPAIAHQLQQLPVDAGAVIGRDRRTKRRRLTATHTNQYVCACAIVVTKTFLCFMFLGRLFVKRFALCYRTVVCVSVCMRLSVLKRWCIVAKRLKGSRCHSVRR